MSKKSKKKSSKNSSSSNVNKFNPNTGKPLKKGETVTISGTNKTVTEGKVGTNSSSSSGGGGSSSSSSNVNKFNPNTGAPLKPGETVKNNATGKFITEGQVGESSSAPSGSNVSSFTQNLKIGSTGQAVKDLQTKLGIPADGIFGPQTQAAVKAYQNSKGLSADGIVGPKTFSSLYSAPGTTPPPQAQDLGIEPPTIPDPVVEGNTVTYNGQTYTVTNPQDAALLQEAIIPYLEQLQQQGLTINPELNLGPDIIAKILDKAKATVRPEFAQQIEVIKQDLTRDIENLRSGYESEVAGGEQDFQNVLGSARESAAESGITFSGARIANELGLKEAQDRNLAALSSKYASTLGEKARGAEENLGTAGFNTAGFNLPSLGRYATNLSGKGKFKREGDVNAFTPGTYRFGKIPQSEEAAALALRNKNIEEASRRKTAGLSYNDLYQ